MARGGSDGEAWVTFVAGGLAKLRLDGLRVDSIVADRALLTL